MGKVAASHLEPQLAANYSGNNQVQNTMEAGKLALADHMDPAPLPRCIQTDLPIRLRDAVATHGHWLREAMLTAPDLSTYCVGWDEMPCADEPIINTKIVLHGAECGAGVPDEHGRC